jgi:hypothetical protein
MRGRAWSLWRAATRYATQNLDVRGWTMIVLMAVWLLLNVFDLLITYDGLSVGVAFEANRVMNRVIHVPAIAASVKMSLAYVVLKLVERVETHAAAGRECLSGLGMPAQPECPERH